MTQQNSRSVAVAWLKSVEMYTTCLSTYLLKIVTLSGFIFIITAIYFLISLEKSQGRVSVVRALIAVALSDSIRTWFFFFHYALKH